MQSAHNVNRTPLHVLVKKKDFNIYIYITKRNSLSRKCSTEHKTQPQHPFRQTFEGCCNLLLLVLHCKATQTVQYTITLYTMQYTLTLDFARLQPRNPLKYNIIHFS